MKHLERPWDLFLVIEPPRPPIYSHPLLLLKTHHAWSNILKKKTQNRSSGNSLSFVSSSLPRIAKLEGLKTLIFILCVMRLFSLLCLAWKTVFTATIFNNELRGVRVGRWGENLSIKPIFMALMHTSHMPVFSSLQFSQLTSIDVDACRRLLPPPKRDQYK